MSMRTVELVPEWDAVPFDGGYEGLRALSDQGFSGVVTAGPSQLYMLNGTVVGILDGDIEAFEDAGGTARRAPHEALPLLVVMQDQDEEPRAQYYTEDTSVAEVDRTLSNGNFTGYVELSENVLSGDYYLVYHQGRSMTVAWVGSAQRLITDDDAFEQADGEVGIYNVFPAEIEPVEIPEPATPDRSDQPAPETEPDIEQTEPEAEPARPEQTEPEAEPARPEQTEPEAEPTRPEQTESEPVTPESRDEPDDAERAGPAAETEPTTPGTGRGNGEGGPPGSKAAGASQGSAVDRRERREDTESGRAEPDQRTPETGTEQPSGTESTSPQTAQRTSETTDHASPEPGESEPEVTQSARTDAGQETADQSGTATSAAALETRSIPSLDPERSSSTASEPADSKARDGQSTGQTGETEQGSDRKVTERAKRATGSDPQAGENATKEASQPSRSEPDRAPANDTSAGAAAESSELEARLEEREAEITQLETELSERESENRELRAERDELLDDLESARAEIRRLEEQLEASGGTKTGGEQLSAAAAIDGTNLFVRYHSKGEATLAKARDGSADRDSVEENLRLEHHTQFDGDNAVVDGEAFETFLQGSIQYRFVDWLVRSLLYEIRGTGHQKAMSDLYEALPEIDRAELNGKVSVTYTEDGEEHRTQEQFDVVVRDRMGNPLVVANINDARQPATEGQMTGILRDAERVGNTSDSLAAAFLVTSSFFEPGALETAEEATSSGLFSRDKRKSFVNLSRKGGYHLCLLEARNREFHLAVPEL